MICLVSFIKNSTTSKILLEPWSYSMCKLRAFLKYLKGGFLFNSLGNVIIISQASPGNLNLLGVLVFQKNLKRFI